MENVRPFFLFLHKFIDLTENEFNEIIQPYLELRQFRKKQVIVSTGEVENYFNYIIRGLVRKYYKKGEAEINTQISTEGHIIQVQESFHGRTPSEFCLETIEPTTLVSITYDNLEKIYSFNFGTPAGTSSAIACESSNDFLPINTLSILLKKSDIP